MNEERRQVLQMLAEGKVTADEAERLIDALERDEPDPDQDREDCQSCPARPARGAARRCRTG